MARIKKQLVALLSAMDPQQIAKLVSVKLKSLRREKAILDKRLSDIGRQIAGLAAPVARKVRRRRRVRLGRPRLGRPRVKQPRMKAAPVRRRAKKGTMAAKIRRILAHAKGPMRVRDLCASLVRSGVPKKPGLMNYLSRTLSTNPAFAKAGWGLYRLAGAAAPAPAAKRRRPKTVEAATPQK